ncbi:MAG: response regulator [Vicinamibacterales bacterium]
MEDNDDVRDMMAVTLQLEGHQVVTAANGREALETLRHGASPCVILLDLMMPVMNGWEFRAALAADPALKDLPVVVISAAGREALESTKAAAYLPKPIDIDTLLDVVCGFCAARRSKQVSSTVAWRRE